MEHHGEGELQVEDRLVFYDAIGPFNYEAILSLRRDIVALPHFHDREPWAAVCRLTGNSLFIPEAEREHREFSRELGASGLVSIAYALELHTGRVVFETQIRRIYDGSGIQLHTVDTVARAREIVLAELQDYRRQQNHISL